VETAQKVVPTNGERTLIALKAMTLVVQRGIDIGHGGVALKEFSDSIKEDEILDLMADILALRKGVLIFYENIQTTCLEKYPHKFLEIFNAQPDQPQVPSRPQAGTQESSGPEGQATSS
jgi:hypothetical protein